jgi:hypothetical protein
MRHSIKLCNCKGCLMEFKKSFYTILYENEFLNPQIFQQTNSLFPEQSTLHKTRSNYYSVCHYLE